MVGLASCRSIDSTTIRCEHVRSNVDGGGQGRKPLPLHLTNARARAGPILLSSISYYEGITKVAGISQNSGVYLIIHFVRHYDAMKKITGKVGGTNGVPSYTYYHMSPIRYVISS